MSERMNKQNFYLEFLLAMTDLKPVHTCDVSMKAKPKPHQSFETHIFPLIISSFVYKPLKNGPWKI